MVGASVPLVLELGERHPEHAKGVAWSRYASIAHPRDSFRTYVIQHDAGTGRLSNRDIL